MRLLSMIAVLLMSAVPVLAQDQAGDIKSGEKVYVDQKCGVCHAIGGKGNVKGPLNDVGRRLSVDEIRLWITDAKAMTAKSKAERKPPMRDYKLPKDQLDPLVAYLASLKK